MLKDYKVFYLIIYYIYVTGIKVQTMFKEFSNNKNDDYLSEFRQKIASERQAELQARKNELQRSRNGFIGTIAGIALAGFVSWFLLVPRFNKVENTEIPLIKRPITPVKIQPNNPGGMEILNQDKPVYNLVEKQEVNAIKVESILPTPETPKLPEIVPEVETPRIETIDDVIDVAEKEIKTDVLSKGTIDELIEKVETTTNNKINIPQKPNDIILKVKTEKVTEKETIKTENKSIVANSNKEIWQLQIMASSNIDSIKKGWDNLSEKHSSLKTLPHEIESAKADNGTLIYRLKAGNFNSKDEASNLCNKLKNQGLSCIVKQKVDL